MVHRNVCRPPDIHLPVDGHRSDRSRVKVLRFISLEVAEQLKKALALAYPGNLATATAIGVTLEGNIWSNEYIPASKYRLKPIFIPFKGQKNGQQK